MILLLIASDCSMHSKKNEFAYEKCNSNRYLSRATNQLTFVYMVEIDINDVCSVCVEHSCECIRARKKEHNLNNSAVDSNYVMMALGKNANLIAIDRNMPLK